MEVEMPARPQNTRTGLEVRADREDVINCFLLVLGRKPGPPADIEFHLGAPIAQIVVHILGSREFLDRVLPQFGGLPSSTQQRQVSLALSDWARAAFGPPVRPGLTLWLPLLASCLSSPAFRSTLMARPTLWRAVSTTLPGLGKAGAEPAFVEPVTQPQANPEQVPRILPTIATADMAEANVLVVEPAREVLPEPGTESPLVARLIFGGAAGAAPQLAEFDPVMAARRLLLSPEFEALVLPPLAADTMPAGVDATSLWGGTLPEELRRFAADTFMEGRLLLGAPQFDEPWPRFLMRLLRHPESLLRPDPTGWAETGLDEAAVERLLAGCNAACASLSRRDPVVASPAFVALPDPQGADALFRYVLGRAPSARDKLEDMAQRGFLNTLLRFLLAPEFERVALWPLRAGKILRHATGAGLEEPHLQALEVILGRAPDPIEDWSQDLPLTLAEPGLLAALAALPLEPAQEETRAFVLSELARLAAEAAAPSSPHLLTELREDRKLCVSVRNLPPGTRGLVELVMSKPEARVICAQVEDGKEAVMLLPAAGFEPHVWIGSLTAHLLAEGDDTAARTELASPRPIRVTLSALVLSRLRSRLEEETRRAVVLAEGGRRREAQELLQRLLAELPGFPPARFAAAALAMLEGETETAEALLAEQVPDVELSSLAELRGRVALRQGKLEDAAAAFALVGERQDRLRTRAIGLLMQACQANTRVAEGTVVTQLRAEALGLLRNLEAPALPLAVTLATVSRTPALVALAREVAAALALGFAPAVNLGEYLRELDLSEVLPIAALLKDPELRELHHLLVGAFGLVLPERIPDAGVLLSVARILGAADRAEEALLYAEEAVRLAPANFDARVVAAQLCRRLRTTEQAIAHLQEALKIKRGDAKATERLLAYEIEAQKQDPLRSTKQQDMLLDRMLEGMQRALVKAPKSPEVRLNYAKFAVTAERLDEATAILHSLVEETPGWAPAVNLLVRIAQARNDHAGVLDWTRRLGPADLDERAVVAAAKAHRNLGEVEAAQGLLGAHLHQPWPTLRREHVRNLFFGANFEGAAREADRLLAEDRYDLELRFLAAAAALELGQNEQAFFHTAWIQMHGGSKLFPLEMPLFLYAALHRNGDTAGALAQLDPMFARVGAQRLALDPRLGAGIFDQLAPTAVYPTEGGPNAPVREGPKVSVVMTTWNVQDYVRTAVRSILQQSYRNLELIIVDDASTDGTPSILAELERSDPRIKLILKSTNDGTYVSKNLGLLQAQGEFVAFQDSDDWSHPDRLGCSLGVLLQRPEVVGLTTDWLRMTTPGDIVIKAGGQIAHLCCISLVYRRAPVIDRIGFFDSVRIAADLELIQRLGLTFGVRAVPRLRWPLLFGRARSDSLTASEEFGLSRTGFTEPREMYHRHADAFHEKVAAGASAYIPFPLRRRLFDAPAIILPAKATP